METLWQDLRYGARLLFRRPGFTAVVVSVLALGIGSNTAIFSVVNSVLLRPLNYPDSGRLMTVWEDHTRRDGPQREWTSPPGFQDWREQNTVFTNMASLTGWGPTLTGAGEPQMLVGANVSADMFSVLGVNPLLGRDFRPEEDKTGAEKVAIISYGLWQRRFSGDPAIIGRGITLSGESYTVAGVMPASFQLPFISDVEVWRTLQPTLNPSCQRGCYTQQVIARLKPTATLEQARAEMSTIAQAIEQQFPDSNKNVGATVTPLHELVVSNVRDGMMALLLAVGFVLLIVCANVANLLLVKAAAREREIAVRAALGASRWQIVRQLLTESLLLALSGGALGVLLAVWLVDLLKGVAPAGTPRVEEIGIDGGVLVFSLSVSALTGLLCGLAPALQSVKRDLNQVLRDTGSKGSVGGGRVRSTLVVGEIAIALTLLIGAGLLLRSFVRLQNVDPGFSPAQVLTARLVLPQNAYANRQQVANFFTQLHERLKSLPGVQSASFGSSVPMTGIDSDTSFVIEGRPAPPPDQRPTAWYSVVSPEYFSTLNVRLREGRFFAEEDHEKSVPVVVISESTARRYWPNENPIGKRLGLGREQINWREIIGVVADVRHFGLSLDARPTIYFSSLQLPRPFTNIVMRVEGNPLSFVPALRREVQALDNSLAFSSVRTMDEFVGATIAVPRLLTLLFGSFAAVALLLAALGIYGVMSFSVTQRVHELGVGIALGAGVRDVLMLVVGQGMKMAAIGVGLGLGAAFALTRLMTSLLFGISATDPLTFVVIALSLAGVALVACYLPARRATKVDPMVALRYQ